MPRIRHKMRVEPAAQQIELYLFVTQGNRPAQHLYEARGFAVVS